MSMGILYDCCVLYFPCVVFGKDIGAEKLSHSLSARWLSTLYAFIKRFHVNGYSV